MSDVIFWLALAGIGGLLVCAWDIIDERRHRGGGTAPTPRTLRPDEILWPTAHPDGRIVASLEGNIGEEIVVFDVDGVTKVFLQTWNWDYMGRPEVVTGILDQGQLTEIRAA